MGFNFCLRFFLRTTLGVCFLLLAGEITALAQGPINLTGFNPIDGVDAEEVNLDRPDQNVPVDIVYVLGENTIYCEVVVMVQNRDGIGVVEKVTVVHLGIAQSSSREQRVLTFDYLDPGTLIRVNRQRDRRIHFTWQVVEGRLWSLVFIGESDASVINSTVLPEDATDLSLVAGDVYRTSSSGLPAMREPSFPYGRRGEPSEWSARYFSTRMPKREEVQSFAQKLLLLNKNDAIPSELRKALHIRLSAGDLEDLNHLVSYFMNNVGLYVSKVWWILMADLLDKHGMLTDAGVIPWVAVIKILVYNNSRDSRDSRDSQKQRPAYRTALNIAVNLPAEIWANNTHEMGAEALAQTQTSDRLHQWEATDRAWLATFMGKNLDLTPEDLVGLVYLISLRVSFERITWIHGQWKILHHRGFDPRLGDMLRVFAGAQLEENPFYRLLGRAEEIGDNTITLLNAKLHALIIQLGHRNPLTRSQAMTELNQLVDSREAPVSGRVTELCAVAFTGTMTKLPSP
jgi:hypothetical protein